MEACIQERVCDAGPISYFRMPAWPDRLVADRSMALDHRSPSDDRQLPWTVLGIMPTNNELTAIDPKDAGPSSRALIEKWGWLHGCRSVLGALATLVFLGALQAG